MRDELLNESLLFGLDHARQEVAAWALDYNTRRPHSSIGYLTPEAFAASLTATGVTNLGSGLIAKRAL
jgi:putative transposase